MQSGTLEIKNAFAKMGMSLTILEASALPITIIKLCAQGKLTATTKVISRTATANASADQSSIPYGTIKRKPVFAGTIMCLVILEKNVLLSILGTYPAIIMKTATIKPFWESALEVQKCATASPARTLLGVMVKKPVLVVLGTSLIILERNVSLITTKNIHAAILAIAGTINIMGNAGMMFAFADQKKMLLGTQPVSVALFPMIMKIIARTTIQIIV